MSIRIGWASTSITPERPVNLFGMFNERISTHVEGPCMATALALESEAGERIIWISCDLLDIRLEVTTELRNAIARMIPELPAVNIVVNCTHTHNAPNFSLGIFQPPPAGTMLPEEYRGFFVERVAAAAGEAWRSRQPGGVATALGYAVLAWCRRAVYADGSGLMYGQTSRDDFTAIEGPMDPGLELLFTFDLAGNPTGVMVNTTCTAQTCMGFNFLTADYWDPARRLLRDHFGPHFKVLATVSAAGDQCTDDLLRSRRSEPWRGGVADGANELGRRLANGVIDAYRHGRQEIDFAPQLRYRHALIDLPAYVLSDTQKAQYAKKIRELVKDGAPAPASWNAGVLAQARELLQKQAGMGSNPRLAADCAFMRIGEMAVATNPFELFLEYGQRIKGRSPARQTVVVQLANDQLQYLPTAAALAHGHYSAMPTDFSTGPEGGAMLVEASVRELKNLWA